MIIDSISKTHCTARHWSETGYAIGEVVCTTAPGRCGHNYARYRVTAKRRDAATFAPHLFDMERVTD